MSNWDLGFSRESAATDEPFDPLDAPSRITFGGDDFDGRPSWSALSGLTSPPPPAPSPAPAAAPPAPPLPPPVSLSWPPTPPPPTESVPWPPAPPPAPPPGDRFEGDHYADGRHAAAGYLNEPWWNPDQRRSGRRWLVPAVVAGLAAVIGATLVLLSNPHSNRPAAVGTAQPIASATAATSPHATSPHATSRPATMRTTAPRKTAVATAPPLTLAAAEAALADYTAVNNGANAERSDSELALVETGASDAIDTGAYALQRAAGRPPYPAFAPVTATYYIPQAEPADGPRWFVARVANAFAANPKKVASTEYLLFTQSAPGGTWRNTVEPYLVADANAAQIAVGANGLATAVSVTSASLAAAPGQLAGLTAASLDGAGRTVSVPDPGGLADRSDQKFWQAKLPTATVTDTAAAAAGADGQTFALRTSNGGAIVFYTDSAELTITAPAGSKLHLNVPGLYSATQALTGARLAYLDQFAAYDPPAGAGAPAVIATYSGITGKN